MCENWTPTRTAAIMLIILGSTLLISVFTSIQAFDLILNDSRLKQLNKKAWPSLADVGKVFKQRDWSSFHKEMVTH